MKRNSESLLDTRSNPLPERPEWGDVSISKAGDVLYLHILKWPETGTIALSDLPVKVTRAVYLDDGKEADVNQGAVVENGATVGDTENVGMPRTLGAPSEFPAWPAQRLDSSNG